MENLATSAARRLSMKLKKLYQELTIHITARDSAYAWIEIVALIIVQLDAMVAEDRHPADDYQIFYDILSELFIAENAIAHPHLLKAQHDVYNVLEEMASYFTTLHEAHVESEKKKYSSVRGKNTRDLQ